MNITVKIDEVSLDTIVGEAFGYDEDGDQYVKGERTVAHLVSEMITERLAKDARYPALLDQFRQIREDEIRTAIRPQIEQAIAAPIRKTNSYGEVVGAETTLREVIVEEARKALNAPADSYDRSRGTFLTKAVEKEVREALSAEIKSAVTEARKAVADEIGKTVAAAVDAGLKAR